MPLAVASYNEITKYLGLKTVPVPVVGTGSMYPSLFWEESEGGPDNSEQKVVEEYRTTPMMYRRYPGFQLGQQTLFRREIELGDMVTFQNSATEKILVNEDHDLGSGFIKRVIALPGDTVELRDGYLYRNSVQVEEPYIYRPRSTYGDETIIDCNILTVPADHYVVLGDNRKTSSDSRGALGLVADSDISFTLPFSQQEIYHGLWRDTSLDSELEGTPTLDAKEFYRLVNEERIKAGLTPYSHHEKLAISAHSKASQILSGNLGYPLSTALSSAGYKNIVTGEFSIQGRFTASELITNIMYFDSTKSQLLDPRYSDIGIYDLNQEVNNCPTEVVVAHLGGYIPAEYDQDTIENWASLRDSLESVIPSWEKARDNSNINQSELEELLTIFHRRLTLAGEIVTTMNNSEWLSDDQLAKIEADDTDSIRSQDLTTRLNKN